MNIKNGIRYVITNYYKLNFFNNRNVLSYNSGLNGLKPRNTFGGPKMTFDALFIL